MKKQEIFTDKKLLEKYSSAFTLSDMEIFIFPELFYSLLIANIMSPEIWKWRNDSWFKNIEKKSFNYKVNRIKQFIMQNFVFNLDLETWGLTSKEEEIMRFNDFVDINILKQSNALFGYEGDKYYFDIDIRKHFGLDNYNTSVIPYWKTETLEAMSAFRHKEEYNNGAGECVSFSALYAAAMFIIGRVPLEKIFLIATPLHSQNFINEKEGVITNNRRIVTKNMWFNGTSLSTKARRALENEKVTIVSHLSGYIHTIYDKATIDKNAYSQFKTSLTGFLKTDITSPVFVNFLRYENKFKKCFQYMYLRNGKKHYILLEKIFQYEHSSKNNFSADSRQALLKEIDAEEFGISPFSNKIVLNDFETYLNQNKNAPTEEKEKFFFDKLIIKPCKKMDKLFKGLKEFVEIKPVFPKTNKEFVENPELCISTENTREEIIAEIEKKADKSEVALLALYAYRKMDKISWHPFIKAAIERNPVCLKSLKDKSVGQIYKQLLAMDNHSIYDEQRLAMPDEVWNFNRGDGIEKAMLLVNFIRNQLPEKLIKIEIDNDVVVFDGENEYKFTSTKNLKHKIEINHSIVCEKIF